MLDVVNALLQLPGRRARPVHGVVVTHDYAAKNGAIPLPATFTIESGQLIGERSQTGMLFRLYSDYSVPLAKGRRPARRLRASRAGGPEAKPRHAVLLASRCFRAVRRCAMRRRGGCRPIASAATTTTPTARSATGRSGMSAASWRSSAPWTATSPGPTRGCAGRFVLMAAVSGTLLALSGLVLVVRSRRAQVRSQLAEGRERQGRVTLRTLGVL